MTSKGCLSFTLVYRTGLSIKSILFLIGQCPVLGHLTVYSQSPFQQLPHFILTIAMCSRQGRCVCYELQLRKFRDISDLPKNHTLIQGQGRAGTGAVSSEQGVLSITPLPVGSERLPRGSVVRFFVISAFPCSLFGQV